MARIKKLGAFSSKKSHIVLEKIVSYFILSSIYFKALIILKTYMILISCRIPWLSKAPKVILYLKVVAISWLKKLDDPNTAVVFVQLETGLELNIIS